MSSASKKSSVFAWVKVIAAGVCVLLFGGQTAAQRTSTAGGRESASRLSAGTQISGGGQQSNPQLSGIIRGEVVDQSGAKVRGAVVRLFHEGRTTSKNTVTDEEGQFFFSNIPPGAFRLTIASPGLASKTLSGTVHAGEVLAVPQVRLVVATQLSEVRVGLSKSQLAELQVKQQTKQRVLGFIPNFYVSYVPNAVPLTTKLKFELAGKTLVDPVTFLAVGGVAGIEQAANRWGAYGQGAQGYAKRFGATYADVFTGTFIGSAVLPSLLKQDPRYFYKGTGSKRSRIAYALANSVICKGDNGRWQPNYSNILGNLASGGLSNLYYPENDRNGVGLVFTNALIRLGETAVANIFQEFVFKKLTPNVPPHPPPQP